jgi:DNA-binding MarR family transcriptional regulator
MKALHYVQGEEDLSVKALGESLGLSLAAMSRAADELVQRGLLDRTEDPSDRRIKRLRLTDAGHELVQKMRELRMAGFEQFVATLTPKERAQLAKALEPILARDELVAFCGGRPR